MIPASLLRWRIAVPAFCVCLGLVAAAVVGLAGGGSSRSGAPVRRTAMADPSSPTQVRQAKAQALAAQRHLASPVARGQRQRSRTQFGGLSSRAALRADRAVPGSALRARTPRPLQAARKQGLKVASFSTPYAAVLRPVSGTKGPGVMAMSSLPMRARDSAGRLRLVDLSVLPAANGFVADNPRVALSIGKRSRDGVRVSDQDVSITPLDINDVPGVRSGEAVAFLETGRDSDHIVQVTPAGVDSQVSIRSAAASTRYRYRIDLPAGGSLRKLDDDSISVRRNGRRVGMITTPTAWDADHRAIPVTSSLVGRVLTLDVGVEGRDVRFPATLDPNYVDILQYSWYTGGRNSAGEPNPRYWNFITNAPAAMSGLFGNYANGASGQTQGLYAGTKGNQATYAGYNAYWHFTAPGTTSVLQAEWTRLSQIFTYAVGPPPCIDFGLTTSSGTWGTLGRECGNQFTPGYRLSCVDCDDTNGFDYRPDITGAQFGAYVPTNTFSNISDYLGESTLYLADADDPSVSLTSQPASGWSENPAGTIAANASDPGLGVQSMSIDGAGTTSNTNCLSAGPCPGSMSASASIATLNVPDGTNTVSVTARDASYFSARNVAAQHIRTVPTTIKRDRDKPVITPSGTLNAARNGFVGPNQDYTLSVTATDGSLSSPAAQRSGVTSLSATLDGQPMTGGSTGAVLCTRPEGSCPLSINATLTGSQIAALDASAPHSVAIKAVDALGHEQTDSFTVRIDGTPPAIYADGNLVDLSGRVLTENSYRLRAEARDNQPFAPEVDDGGKSQPVFELPGSGLRDLVIRLDGQSVATTRISCIDDNQCDDSRTWDWDATNVANGSHTITITATDNAGNDYDDSFDVTMNHQPDEPARTSTTIAQTIRGASLGDRAGTSVAALGDLDGDGHTDYLVGAPGVSNTAGAAYVVLGTQNPTTIDLATPGTSVRRLTGAAAGNACGTAVAAAGDVNGDGRGDFLVGCPGVDPGLGSATATRGKVYVVFGRTDPQDLSLSTLDVPGNAAGFAINGPSDPGTLGLPLSQRPAVFGERLQNVAADPVPDVNDDGFADIVIGDSAQAHGTETAAGAAYVVYGKTDGQPVDATALGSGGYVIRGSGTNSLTGYSATISDDLTGDTVSDVLVGAPAPTTGRAFVVPGQRDGDVELASNPSGVVAMTSGETGDRFGVGVAALGDTNLDTTADIAVGTRSGAFVVRNIPSTSRQITSDDGYRVVGPTNSPGILAARIPETTLSPSNDLDGDERNDLIVGYPDVSPSRAYTIRSPESSRTLNVAALPGQRGATVAASGQGDRSGAAVAANQYQGTTPVSENAQAIIGAPDAQADILHIGAGQAQVIAEPTPAGPGVEPDVNDSDVAAPAAQARAARVPCGTQNSPCHAAGWYQIDVAPETAWTTVRNQPQLLVIGNALRGNYMHTEVQGTDAFGKTVYDHGRLYGGVQRCGWVRTAALTIGSVSNPLGSKQAQPCGKRRILAPRTFARLINCGLCDDGSPVRLTAPKGRSLPAGIPVYRNVRPGTHEAKYNYVGDISTMRDTNGDGQKEVTAVNWRYITKSNRFAMVRLPFLDQDKENAWVFIERKWLPRGPGPGGLCDNRQQPLLVGKDGFFDRDDAANRNFNAEKAVGQGLRQGRGNWAPVCAKNRYDGR